jgi:hypothetical protein
MLEINKIFLCCLIPERLQEGLIVGFAVDNIVETPHWERIVLHKGESHKEAKSIG